MGALFSSEPPARTPPRSRQPSMFLERVPPRPDPRPMVTNTRYSTEVSSNYRTQPTPNSEIFPRTLRSTENIRTLPVDPLHELTNKFYTLTMNQCLRECSWLAFSNEIDFLQLNEHSPEYDRIKYFFAKNLRQENPSIMKIEKVKNYVLMGQYLLKKQQYRRRNIDFDEKYYYHGTKQNNLMSICRENFSWRITNRNKFGKGVSFARTSSYAIHYCDKQPHMTKIMFVAKVLIGKPCLGYENMELPLAGFDTSMKNDGKVIVKFYDNEFYPEYLIHFTANIIRHNNNNRF